MIIIVYQSINQVRCAWDDGISYHDKPQFFVIEGLKDLIMGFVRGQ